MQPLAHPLGAHPLGAAGSWGRICVLRVGPGPVQSDPDVEPLRGLKGVLIQCWFDCTCSARVGGVWPGPHKCGWCGATGPTVEGVLSRGQGEPQGMSLLWVSVLPIPLRGLKGSEVYGVHAFGPYKCP